MTAESNHGGKRKGAGRKEGSMLESTKLRNEKEQAMKDRIAGMTDKLLNAQSATALGETNLYVKRTIGKGKNQRVETVMIEDPGIIKQYLNGDFDDEDDEYYYIATKSPDNRAIDSMLDRTYGKARQSVDVTSGGEKLDTDSVPRATVDEFGEFMKQKTKAKGGKKK